MYVNVLLTQPHTSYCIMNARDTSRTYGLAQNFVFSFFTV